MITFHPSESLLALAPTTLPNRRRARYLGDNVCIALPSLATRDQTLLGNFYRVLIELLFAMANPANSDTDKWRDVTRWMQQYPVEGLIDDLQALGEASDVQGSNEALSKAIHDIRGGALSALLGRLQLLGHLPHSESELNTLFILTRDHLKIMRSAVVGLDDARREADRRPKSHAMQLMVDKWRGAVVGPRTQGRSIRMFVECSFEGALTECCLESAAIDRLFYNLSNNACRHAATDRLDMVVFPVPDAAGECLRFVLSNEVSAADAARLGAITRGSALPSHEKGRGSSLLPLFTPKVSTTGSGFGLTVVADFVAGAFGLQDRTEALRERYVGAVLEGNTFRIWFHWPIANQSLPPKQDDYHHPAESLSEP